MTGIEAAASVMDPASSGQPHSNLLGGWRPSQDFQHLLRVAENADRANRRSRRRM